MSLTPETITIPYTGKSVTLRPLDDFFTCDISLGCTMQKWQQNGIAGVFDVTQKLPCHAGKIIAVDGVVLLAEMLKNINDKGMAQLCINRIDQYLDNGIFGSRIVAIKRCAVYDDKVIQDAANDRIYQRWLAGETKYEYAGFLESSGKKKVSNLGSRGSKKLFHCSELCEDELNKDGYSYTDFPLQGVGFIPEADLFNAEFVVNKAGDRKDYSFL